MVISRSDLETLQDAIYALQSALDDVDADLADGGGEAEALRDLYRATSEWRGLRLEPRRLS